LDDCGQGHLLHQRRHSLRRSRKTCRSPMYLPRARSRCRSLPRSLPYPGGKRINGLGGQKQRWRIKHRQFPFSLASNYRTKPWATAVPPQIGSTHGQEAGQFPVYLEDFSGRGLPTPKGGGKGKHQSTEGRTYPPAQLGAKTLKRLPSQDDSLPLGSVLDVQSTPR